MNRRGFLGVCLATFAAPAIVRASSLMPVVARRQAEVLFRYEDTIIIDQMRGGMRGGLTDFGVLTEAQKRLWARALLDACERDPMPGIRWFMKAGLIVPVQGIALLDE